MKLIPDLVEEADGDWDRLRAACVEAVRQLKTPVVWHGTGGPAADAPHRVVIVGGDNTTRSFDPSRAYGSLLSNGVFWEYGWGSDSEDAQPLPLSLTLGYWLLLNAKAAGIIVADVAFEAIAFDASPAECAALGQELAERAKRVALLVMGEGSTCMTPAAWGRWGERARLCDTKAARALEHADADALGRLDPAEFRPTATGRAPWQVLAGAATGRQFQGQLHMDMAIGDRRYFAASWTLRS